MDVSGSHARGFGSDADFSFWGTLGSVPRSREHVFALVTISRLILLVNALSSGRRRDRANRYCDGTINTLIMLTSLITTTGAPPPALTR